jgi:hypothetical protein
MMNSPYRRAGGLGLILAVLATLCGCQQPAARIEIKSFRDPYFPETFPVDLITCAYREAASGDIHVVGFTDRSTENPAGDVLRQYVHVHMYWHPHPGRTHADSNTTNAAVRYLVATREGVAVYAGTGFAFPRKQKDGRLILELETARLRLESTSGNLEDFLGHAWMTGTLVARPDLGGTAQAIREMELLAARDEATAQRSEPPARP